MYGSDLKSGAHKITTVVFLLVAIGVVAAAAKIVLDHVNADGTVTAGKEAQCDNQEGMDTLEKAGVYGSAKPRCR